MEDPVALEDQIEIIYPEKIDIGLEETADFIFTEPTDWSIQYKSLSLSVKPRRSLDTQIGNIVIKEGELVGRVDFMPNGKIDTPAGSNPNHLLELIDCIHSLAHIQKTMVDRVEIPKYIASFTNRRMANFVTQLGFQIVELEGNEDPDFVRVVARTDNVLEKYKEFIDSNSELLRRLKSRSDKKQSV